MKFLVDANVLSEPTKPKPHSRVVEWLRDNESELAIDAIVLGELEYGVEKVSGTVVSIVSRRIGS